MPRLFLAFLVALFVSMPAQARDLLHVSTVVVLSTTPVCTAVGLTDATRADSGGEKVRKGEHLSSLEVELDTIVTAVSYSVKIYRDAACNVPISDLVTEADIDVNADASGGSASKIDVTQTTTDDTVSGLLYVALYLDAGSANGVIRITGSTP